MPKRPRRDAQERLLKVLALRGCGLTQQQTAKRLRISVRTVQRLERQDKRILE